MLRQLLFLLPVFVAGIVLGAWAREPVSVTTSQTARDFDHAADYERLDLSTAHLKPAFGSRSS